MIAFPKYPKYKDSGVEWLGEVPDHWEVKKGRYLFTESNERSQNGLETHLSMSQRYGLVPADQLTAKSLQSESYEGAKLCFTGDIVLNRLKAHLGVFAVARQNGVISPDYSVFRLRDPSHQPQYFESLCKTPAYLTAFNKAVRGIVVGFYRLYTGDFFDIPFLVPPKPEQDRIVAFLDEKTAEIDRLIAKKQRQIELLDEQKAILINRAVTRGLNPHAELQDSGIPWIGPIPKHWKVMKLKYLISIQAGYAFASSAYSHNAGDTRLLRGVNVNPGKITWNDVVYWPEKKMRGVEAFALAEDDMVMGMDRPWVSSGVRVARITKADLPCLLLQRVARIRATKIEPDFLERVLTGSGFKSYFEPILTGVSVPHISPDQIGGYTAAVPPLPEQKAICSFISQVEALCSKVKATEESQIQTLQTLRSTLIAHAVTGKIAIPAATA